MKYQNDEIIYDNYYPFNIINGNSIAVKYDYAEIATKEYVDQEIKKLKK